MQASSVDFRATNCQPSREHSLVFECFVDEVRGAPGFHEAQINGARQLLFFHGLGMQSAQCTLVAVRLGCSLGGFPMFAAEFAGYRMGLMQAGGNEITYDIFEVRDHDQFRQLFAEVGLQIQAAKAGTSLEAVVAETLARLNQNWEYASYSLGIKTA